MAFGFAFISNGRAQAEAYIDRRDVDWNKWLFDALHAERMDIEAAFGEPLVWERLDSKQASRISARRTGSIEEAPEALDEIQHWAIDRLLRLKRVIGPRVAALAAAGPQLHSLQDPADEP